jgi:hypothetical protein
MGLCNVTPNPAIDRSAQQLRGWVPAALRAPAPGHCARSAASSERAHGSMQV